MLKRLMTVLILGTLFSVHAQTDDVKADSVNYEQPDQWKLIGSEAPVKAFAIKGSVLWYATASNVVAQPMTSNNQRSYNKLGSIPAAGVTSMAADGSGKIWFATPAGVAARSGRKFTSYTTENGLPDNNAMAVAASGRDVWVGTAGGAALFKGGEWKTFTTEDGLVSNKVKAIAVDSKGTVWFGTDKGISAYDGTEFTNHTMQNGLSWNDTKALAADPHKNMVWAAVGDRDVNCWNGSEWKTYLEIESDITSIMADPHRTWFGSGSGLLRFNSDEWVSDPNKIGIPAAQVFQMHEDSKGNLWFAMEKGIISLSNPYR
ncbi:MAG: two-component regulator propeller domain-containing protein [Chitinispirillaceae bacterium]